MKLDHDRTLPPTRRVTERPTKGQDLLPRVRENERILLADYRNIAETVRVPVWPGSLRVA